MKKFLAIFCSTLLISFSANATGFFIGADALFASAKHKAKSVEESGNPRNLDKQDADKFNYGVNAGVRFDFLNLLASGELFYDKIDTSSRNFALIDSDNNNQDSIEIKDRYGAKLNVGFAILPKVTPFLTYGLTKVSYSSKILSDNNSVTKSEFTPLYGLGLLIDLPFTGLSAKASYDYQNIDMRYAQDGAKIKTHLGVAKLGVVYNF